MTAMPTMTATPAHIVDRNRLNALSSTGPRTDEGKAIARRNSLKHGLTANPAAGVIEDGEAFDRLLRAVAEQVQPVGPIEEGLTHQIAVALYRLQRAARVDAALTTLSATAVTPGIERVHGWMGRIYHYFQESWTVEEKDPRTRPSYLAKGQKWHRLRRPYLTDLDRMRTEGELAKDGAALAAMQFLLDDLRVKIADPKRRCQFGPREAQILAWLLGDDAGRLCEEEEKEPGGSDGFFYPDERVWRSLNDALIGEARNDKSDNPTSPELLSKIDAQITTLALQQRTCADPMTWEQDQAHKTAGLLLDEKALERLMRYENHMGRTLKRALETLAMMRGGRSQPSGLGFVVGVMRGQ